MHASAVTPEEPVAGMAMPFLSSVGSVMLPEESELGPFLPRWAGLRAHYIRHLVTSEPLLELGNRS